MKQATARVRFLKIAPRKLRLIANTLKGLSAQEAEAQLMMRSQRSAPALLKLLRSAIANAKNLELDKNKLVVSGIWVDQGPMLKRTMPRAMGRATLIQKKMSHLTIILEEKEKPNAVRFNIVVPKKEKKEKKGKSLPSVERKGKKMVAEAKIEKDQKKDGVFRRFFRRKAV